MITRLAGSTVSSSVCVESAGGASIEGVETVAGNGGPGCGGKVGLPIGAPDPQAVRLKIAAMTRYERCNDPLAILVSLACVLSVFGIIDVECGFYLALKQAATYPFG